LATGVVVPSNLIASVKQGFQNDTEPFSLKGKINHSACRWCYSQYPITELAKNFKAMGMVGMDLVGPSEWHVLKENNLVSTMCNGAEISLTKGFNEPSFHDTLVKNYTDHINYVADAGYTNLICFSGNRKGIDDETGLNNCVTGLKKIMALAEKRGVMIQMELLNSKIDHKDYMCDRSVWGVELCKRIGSPNFKLLFDIYHMQIDEGDVIRTINANHTYYGHYHTGGVTGMELLNSKIDHKDYMCDRSVWGVELCKRIGSPNFKLLFDIYHMQIDEGDIIRTINANHTYYGHYHTGGVPGRNEIDERQELYYPAIMRAIVATGFKGYVAQEFIPADKDPMVSLKKAIEICDI